MIPSHNHDAPTPLPPRAERRIALSLASLWIERVWTASWPASGILLGFIALSLFDVWRAVPPLLHIAALACAICAIVYFLILSARSFERPTRSEAIRRLEADSALRDRPLETLSDRLPADTDDAFTLAIWAAAQRRAAQALARLKTGVPRASLSARDPQALRFAALLLIVLGAWMSGPDSWGRIASGFAPSFEHGSGTPVALDAWIDPPPYTGLAPVFLARGAIQSTDDEISAVPQGAILTMRLHGKFSKAQIELKAAGQGHRSLATLKLTREASGTLAGTVPLERTSEITLRAGGRVLGRWPVNVLLDQPPQISFDGEIKSTVQASMRIPYKVFDDFGLKTVELKIRLADKPDGEVLTFPLTVPTGKYSADKPARLRAYKDLSAHPWAGAQVIMTLVATDARGQQGLSAPITMTLPERPFTNPLARALVDARRRMAMADNGVTFATQFLKAATGPLAPEIPFTSVFLALRTAYWELADKPQADNITNASDLMWNAALALEQGVTGDTQRDLQAAKDALAKALRDKAPQEEIAQKLQALREALNHYLDEMSKQMGQQAPSDQNAPQSGDAKTITPEDFKNLLDTLENLAQTGANEQAEQLLGALDDILQNMQPSTGEAPPSPQDQARQNAMNDLGKIIGDQRKLMDETHRQNEKGDETPPKGEQATPEDKGDQQAQGPSGSDKQGSDNQGSSAGKEEQGGVSPEERSPGKSGGSLAERQEDLRNRLGDAMGKLGEGGGDIPQALGRADRAMKDAQHALRDGNQRGAIESQKEALDALRDGAQSIAKAMDEAQRQANGQSGRSRSARDGGTDPFGRPMAGAPDLNSTIEVPEKGEIQRAREILNEIRRRAAERGRPQSELDYLDRLLERF